MFIFFLHIIFEEYNLNLIISKNTGIHKNVYVFFFLSLSVCFSFLDHSLDELS